MAFRRQDIPKTTRKGGEGEPRRLYPRYAKDKALLPKIDLAVGYLDSMVGRRRGDLAPDAVLDLFGDPKLARCFLACLADSYRYRTPALAEVVGDEPAGRLAAAGLRTPADVRAAAYLEANRAGRGFVAPSDRDGFLAGLAAGLGVSAAHVEEALHLDAERNAVLVRTGDRPRAEDVRARYNVLLTVSALRHASEVELGLPGVDREVVAALCDREGVPCRWLDRATLRLSGRRSALGSWSQFGLRVARLTVGLLLYAPGKPTARAVVHLNGHPLALDLEGFALNALRLPARAAAGPDETIFAAELTAAAAAARRRSPAALRGWTIRRATEPLVVDGAIVLPEFVCLRDDAAVALVPIPAGERRDVAAAAVEHIAGVRPVLGLGGPVAGVPSLPTPDIARLVNLLDAASGTAPTGRTALAVILDELATANWVGVDRLHELFGADANVLDKVAPLVADAVAELVPGFGLCSPHLLRRLRAPLGLGPLDVGGFRAFVAEAVGEGAGADALALHLLTLATSPAPTVSLRPSA